MLTAFLCLLAFALGFLLPRDAFPWMRRFSAWLMSRHDNRRLGLAVVALAAAALLVLVALGCSKREAALSTGRELSLTAAEQRSIYFRQW